MRRSIHLLRDGDMKPDEYSVLAEGEEKYEPGRVWMTDAGQVCMAFNRDDPEFAMVKVKVPLNRVEAVIERYRSQDQRSEQ